ncbi:hypothetical protein [Falsihalocynthiibacter sp. CO-5D18]|uniref:hypothetical protein n=1 Tax=Falsihalocynthiibacter sp. CO-5D18 TaxID=3240872 RepID=UPI00350ED9E1
MTFETQAVASKRRLSIQQALIWTFRDECASIDFDEVGTETGANVGLSMEARMIEQARLGCRVDGGGRSDPHPDAEYISSTVSALPISVGGKWMACRIAEFARGNRVPDWGQGLAQVMCPVEIALNQHGQHAKTAVAHSFDACGWRPEERRTRKGKIVLENSLCCPVMLRPTSSQIAAWRRAYLDWWGALLELASSFRGYMALSTIDITDAMPPMTPWKNNA